MQTLADIEREAMKLPDRDRAYLASRLLDSLPEVLSADDDGLAEANRRSAEMAKDPGSAMTFEEVRQAVKR
jgi:putative addiction module component (TIGR02574 family)